MGIFDHLKHLLEDELHHGGHHRRRHHGGHHYDHHYEPPCELDYGYPRQPIPPPMQRPVAPQQQQSAAAVPCSKCGRFNPSHVLFCQQCGVSLAGNGDNIPCGGCGTQLAPDAKFCGQCGRPQA